MILLAPTQTTMDKYTERWAKGFNETQKVAWKHEVFGMTPNQASGIGGAVLGGIGGGVLGGLSGGGVNAQGKKKSRVPSILAGMGLGAVAGGAAGYTAGGPELQKYLDTQTNAGIEDEVRSIGGGRVGKGIDAVKKVFGGAPKLPGATIPPPQQ